MEEHVHSDSCDHSDDHIQDDDEKNNEEQENLLFLKRDASIGKGWRKLNAFTGAVKQGDRERARRARQMATRG
jgi:hypothetical protein